MAIAYQLPENALSYLRYYTKPTILVERDNYMDIIGQAYDKYSLSKFKSVRDTNGCYYTTQYPFFPQTTTRFYSEYFNASRFLFKLPFSPKDTLFRNNIRFEDGTEIITNAGSNDYNGSSYSNYIYPMLFKYNKSGKIEKCNTTSHSYICHSPLIKLDEESFLFHSYNSPGYYYGSHSLRTGYTQANVDSYISNHYTYASNYDTSYGINDTLYKYSKNTLTSIKSLELNGELINIVGRSKNGNLIAIMVKHKAGATNLQKYQVISITPDLTLTVLASKDIKTKSTFNYLTPALSSDKKYIYFLNNFANISAGTKNTEFFRAELNIAEETCKFSDNLITYDDGIYNVSIYSDSYNYTMYTCPVTSFTMNCLNFNGKEYLLVAPVFNIPEILKSNQSGMTYASGRLRSEWDNFSKIYLFEINNANNSLKLKDSISQGFTLDDPSKALLPINDNKSFILVGKNSCDIYNIDLGAEKFIKSQSIPGPFAGLGVDELERIWFLRDSSNASLEMINTGLSINVSIDFENTDITHDDVDINNNIIVEAKNYNNERVSLGLKLIIEGKGVFTENSLKTINVTTKTDSSTKVPITIKGDGNINVYGSVIV